MSTAPLVPSESSAAPVGGAAASDSARRGLHLVAQATRQRMAPAVIFSALVLVAALFAVLLINITVSRQQYSLVSLRQEQTQLQASNAVLNEELANAQAPQSLAQKAKKLGMVYSSSYATVDVASGSFGKQGIPAITTENFVQSVPAPLAPKTRAAVDPTVTEQSVKASEEKISEADLNGGTIPAPAQKPLPAASSGKTASTAEKKR